MTIEIAGGKKFGFEHPSDMLDKLTWEYQHVRESGFSNGREFSYNVINFAVTAWHLMDWAFPHLPDTFRSKFKDKGEFATWLKKECRELAACQAIANECKHFVVKQSGDSSVEVRATSGWMGAHNEAPARHMIEIAIDGNIFDIDQFASKVHSFWIRFLDAHGLCADRGIDWTND